MRLGPPAEKIAHTPMSLPQAGHTLPFAIHASSVHPIRSLPSAGPVRAGPCRSTRVSPKWYHAAAASGLCPLQHTPGQVTDRDRPAVTTERSVPFQEIPAQPELVCQNGECSREMETTTATSHTKERGQTKTNEGPGAPRNARAVMGGRRDSNTGCITSRARDSAALSSRLAGRSGRRRDRARLVSSPGRPADESSRS